MADYITNDTDLLAGEYVTYADYDRLTPQEWTEAPGVQGPWTPRHRRAWTEIKYKLKALRDPVEESDLSDTTELKHLVCLYVMHLAYLSGGDSKRAGEMLEAFNIAWTGITPTLTSGDELTIGRGIPMWRV